MFTIINRIFIFIWYKYDIENWYHYNMKFYIALRYRYNIIMMLEKEIIYIIGLYRDVNPTKNRCRHIIGCPLAGWYLHCTYCLIFFLLDTVKF